MAAAQGFASQLGWAASGTADTRFEFISESLRKTGSFHYSNGIQGSREYDGGRVVAGVNRVAGTIVMQPNPVELDALLPFILGADESTDVFDLADALQLRDIAIDRVTKVFTYAYCVCARAVFSVTSGGPLQLSMDIIGRTESVGNAGTFPSLSIGVLTGPYMMHNNTTATVGGSSITFRDLEITIDNMVDDSRYLNSQNIVSSVAQDRNITIALTAPYGDSSSFYSLSSAGVASVFTFTNAGASITFTFGKIHYPVESPIVEGKSEIWLPLSGRACKTGSTPSLRVTNDSTL